MFGALQNIEEILFDPTDEPEAWCGCFVPLKMAILRVLNVIFTLVVAGAVPDFGFLVGIVGCFSQSLLAFVLPPAFYLSLHWDQLRADRSYGTIALQGTVLVGGTVFCVASTVQMVLQKA